MRKQNFCKPVIAAMLAAALPLGAAQAKYPERLVKIVVAYPAGSTMDSLARMLAGELQTMTNATFVVENRPGAAGQLGAEHVAKAEPDGYTLFISGSSTHSANPSLYKQLRYDPVKDFTPIIQIVSLTYALVANENAPANTISELKQWGEKAEKGLSYAYGSQLGQIAGATISSMLEINTVSIPYKGQPPAITDLIGNQVDFMIADIPILLPHIKADRIKPLAVLNDDRSPLLPDVPTLQEQGYADYGLVGWIGLSAPANTPEDVVQFLSDAMDKVLSNPPFRDKLSSMGMEYAPNTPEQFGQLVANQVEVWAEKVKDAGISPQ